MSQVVADVPKDTPTVDSDSGVPVIEENGMGELVEGTRKGDEKGWWHNEAIFVHRKIVVDAVEKEMSCYAHSVVW